MVWGWPSLASQVTVAHLDRELGPLASARGLLGSVVIRPWTPGLGTFLRDCGGPARIFGSPSAICAVLLHVQDPSRKFGRKSASVQRQPVT